MNFTSPAFIAFIFLSLAVYFIIPKSQRRLALLVMSLLWYASWNELWVVVLLSILSINYLLLSRSLITAIVFDVILLIFTRGASSIDIHFINPFGSGLFGLLLLGVLIDHFRSPNRLRAISFVEFSSFCLFFPLLVSGPIERYSELGKQMESLPDLSRQNLEEGSLIFFFGLFKKLIVADALSGAVSQVRTIHNQGLCNLILAGLLSTYWIYVDLSSYCDMGRGVARCFGLRLTTNFKPFYYASDPTDFWRRWNITLGTWIRDYVTLPLLLRYGRKVSRYLILLFAFVLLGLWHGFYVNWLIFGLFNGLLVVTSLWLRDRMSSSMPTTVSIVGFFLVFCLFFGNGILQSVTFGQLAEVGRILALKNGLGDFIQFKEILMAALPFLTLGFVIDALQERAGKPDFYLDYGGWQRGFLGLTFACVGLGKMLYDGPSGIPPLYFRF